jgi:hypothetical protein
MPLLCRYLLIILAGFAATYTRGNDNPAVAQLPGEQRLSLDGTWDFTTDSAAIDNKDAKWDSLAVPGNWDVQPTYSTYSGKAWYRRTFTVPESWKGQHIYLCFGAVNQEAQVSLNGKDLGKHIGGYTPFDFDVTQSINYGGENTVVVSADNTYHRGAWWPWGGISRSVYLVAYGDAHIVWQHITSTPDLDKGTAAIQVGYNIANDSDKEQTINLASTLDQASGFKIDQSVTIPPRAEKIFTFSASLPKEDVHLWDFDHPHLYTLSTRLTAGNTPLHEKTDRFGIRKVEIKPDGLYLNGEKIRAVGFNRVSDSNQTGSTEPDSLVQKDIDLMKSAGANFARLMHTPQAPNLLDYLDEKGMMIVAEIPVWGGGDPQVKKDNPLTEQWLTEMINRDYNHPSIIGWSPGNEINGHYNYVHSMLDYIRQNLDSSRLLTYTSNTAAWVHPDPIDFCDYAQVNSYGGFTKLIDTVHRQWPDKPIFFSEWGVHQIGASPEAKIPGFEKCWKETIENHPYVIGLSIWTFNDYRSGMKGTPASGNREWGVVGIDRKPKAAYYQVRKAYSPVHSISIADGKIRIEPRSPDEVPSYALRGYQIQWKSDSGTPASGTISIPDLKPGDPAWETSVPASGKLEVSLVTPTGYAVDEASSN